MFTFRYHLVSLAAVFIALAVGILLGAAISGKLGDAEDALTKDRIDSLNEQLAQERTRTADAERSNEATRQVLEDAYPALMDQRLAGRGYAVLFLGPVDGDVRSAVERTLADADAGSPVRMIALDTPLDPQALDDALNGTEELARYAEEGDDFGVLGEALGRELVDGEGSPLWSALSGQLIEERTGATSGEVEGVVVVRSWPPAEDGDPADSDDPETQATESLFEGLITGIMGADVPLVGVETSDAAVSTVTDYTREGSSSVDDVDTTIGRLALALLLAGGQPGHYGVKDSATDGAVPPIEPVTTTTGG
jgi:Copper transport outer membrane protein, MctB